MDKITFGPLECRPHFANFANSNARAPVTWAYGARLMNRSKLRRQIAWEAARLMYSRQESEYYTAKMKAARQICQGWVKPADFYLIHPSNDWQKRLSAAAILVRCPKFPLTGFCAPDAAGA